MTQTHPLGEVLHDGDTIGLRYERVLSHPVERVWRALTDSDQLRHWLPVDLVGERVVGGELHATFWPDVVEKYQIADPTLPARILVWDPPHRFSWMWDRDTLIFELHPTATGTRLVFTTWIVDTTAGVDKTGAGYHVCLDQLMQLVETDDAPPFIDADPTQLEQAYAALLPQ
ncbi:MAG: SRPBCC domain-containing protein [Ilumatobacteraceae bacterium]